MKLEETQARFEMALEELNQESKKRGIPQNAVWCDEEKGVFITFAGVEVNYSIIALDKALETYLQAQTENHESYLRVLQVHRLQIEQELRRARSRTNALLQRFSKPPKEELERLIERGVVKVLLDKVLKEGALLGNYFFEEIVADYTKNKLEEVRKKLVTATDNIYRNAKTLEAVDIDRLQYFRNKELLLYGRK